MGEGSRKARPREVVSPGQGAERGQCSLGRSGTLWMSEAPRRDDWPHPGQDAPPAKTPAPQPYRGASRQGPTPGRLGCPQDSAPGSWAPPHPD